MLGDDGGDDSAHNQLDGGASHWEARSVIWDHWIIASLVSQPFCVEALADCLSLITSWPPRVFT